MPYLRTFFLSVIVIFSIQMFSVGPAKALPCDDRGSNWQGRIQIGSTIWGFELRRQTCAADSLWNYYLWSRTTKYQGQATVWKGGTSLNVSTINGGASGCTLSGTWYVRDVTNGRPYRGNGTATCAGVGVWSAVIR